MNERTYTALEQAIRLMRYCANLPIVTGTLSSTQMLSVDTLILEWTQAQYTVGAVRRYNDQLYRCREEHDSIIHSDWTPEDAPSLWKVCHSCDPRYAKPYLMRNANDSYMAGECMIWTDGYVYLCLNDNTVYSPDEQTQLWERITI